MSQFRIRGIDYADENLQHGLGIGSGRGRPKGSKNGQIMPGAAYMKNYKIVGEKAEGTTNLPGAQNTNRLAGPINPNLQRDYQRAISQQNQTQTSSSAQRQTRNTQTVRSNSNQRRTSVQQPVERQTSTPATAVARGKNAVDTIMNRGTTSTNNQASTEAKEINDWPWSARRVNAAGGLAAREGRQIVYDNPTLNEDYKKHIAKIYGDSDGKSYPKKYEKPQAESAPGTPEERQEFVNEVLRSAPDNMDPQLQRFLDPLSFVENTDSNPTGNANQNGNKSGDTNQNPARTDENKSAENTAQGQTPTDNSQQGQTPAANAQQGQAPAANTQQEQPQASTQQRQETPEQKSLWDNIGGWFAQAGKDIGDTVVGAWNTASGAVSDAANWVGDRLREGGEWALASMGDVGEWIGDRAEDFNGWWNGRDVEVNDNGRTRQAHQTGAREAIEDWWNGRDTVNVEDGRYGRTHEAGARENIGNALNAAGQWIGNAVGDVSRAVGGAANTAGQWIGNAAGDVGRTVGNAANAAGQWVGNAAGDVGRTVGNAANGLADNVLGSYQIVGTDANGNPIYGNQRRGGLVNRAINSANQAMQDARNFVTGVEPGSPEAAPYYDLRTGQWVDPVQPSLGTRIGTAANDAWNGVTGAVNDAGQWVNNNVVAPVSNAANGVGDFVRNIPSNVGQAVNNAGQAVNDWWNGTDQRFLGIPIGHTPGARENIGNAVNQAVRTVSDAANNAGRAIGNFTSDAADAINATPGAAIGLSRAVASGVPLEYASRLTNNYVNGQITREQYEESIDRLINESGPWGR